MPSSAASDSPAPAPRVITIGVYEFDLPSFLAALRASHVALLVDVRQRRGVRGAVLPPDATTALLCVEADPEACHRSLIAERLAQRYRVPVGHVRPGEPAAVSARR